MIMWNLVLVLAGNAIILVLGWWVRKMYPEIPDWALLATAAFLGFGVIPVAAFERWRRIVFSALTLNLFTCRELRQEIAELQAQFAEMEASKTQSRQQDSGKEDVADTTVDYIGAGAIVDAYISPATRDMRDGTRLVVRRNFLDRFDKVTGAKLGEYEYNRALLHQWMRSNAARFLVDNRGEML